MSVPTARTIRRALDVLERLPPEALGMVAEAIIDRLDAAEPDLDLEDDDVDCCLAGDDDPASSRPSAYGGCDWAAGDPDDAEDDDEYGEDEEERGEDEPVFIPSIEQIRASLQKRGMQ